MASSRVMPSSSTANSDLACEPSINSFTMTGDRAGNMRSTSMDDLLRNIYGDGTAAVASPDTPFGGDAREAAAAPPPLSPAGSLSLPRSIGSKTVEEVWSEISGGRKADGGGNGSGYKEATAAAAAEYGEMTLEDFLARAGAVREEDVGVPPVSTLSGGFGVDALMNDRFGQQQAQLLLENPILGFGNGVEGGGGGGGRGGRGMKRPGLDPVGRAAVQRQKRMIRNRESAARSRERKQVGDLIYGS